MVSAYEQWIEAQIDAFPVLLKIKEIVSNIGGKNAVIFAHDDPDGLTSAALLQDIIAQNGGEVQSYFPPAFKLGKEEASGVCDDRVDVLFIIDKGTFADYDRYVTEDREVVIIDHHPPMSLPQKSMLFNPNISYYQQCSTSFLIHLIARICGIGSSWHDLMALIGLKGDFAVEPATDVVSPFVQPFYEQVSQDFSRWLVPFEGSPTLFDVTQRKRTTLLNQVTEIIHIACGGGFQFFFKHEDASLVDVDEPRLTFEQLLFLRQLSSQELCEIRDKDRFLEKLPEGNTVRKITVCFHREWDRIYTGTAGAVPLLTIGQTTIFFFVGETMPLMPMICSVRVYELQEQYNCGEAVGLFFNIEPDKLHLTARGTGEEVHCGDICRLTADRLSKHSEWGNASGGGHPKAAECVLRNAACEVAFFLEELLVVLRTLKTS